MVILASAVESALAFGMMISNVYASQALFDAHLHYDAEDAEVFSPDEIIETFERNNIRHALVTSTPASQAEILHQKYPRRIVPFLGVYQSYSDKEDWHRDASIPKRVREQLRDGPWRGIGELHLFAEHRHSPVLREIVGLAARNDIPLMMHADPAVIDTIYEIEPQATVIWAHAGTFPYPDLVADYLQRYPDLYVDLSMRDERIAPQGSLADSWYDVFVQHPDRFLIGVDTYSTHRWRNYAAAIDRIRTWLEQLPKGVAARLAFENSARLFNFNINVDAGQ